MNKKSILVIPIFVPHAGCPHDCVFCNQKIISGQTKMPDEHDVLSTIHLFEPAAPRYDETELAFYGGSFTAIPGDDQVFFLRTVQPYLKINGGFIDTLRLSTRPDCIDEEVIARLKKYNVSIVELGAQSMDDTVLLKSERGHTAQDTVRASEMLKKAGFVLGIQTMTGLPGATVQSDLATADIVCKIKPDLVRIYPTIVIHRTKLCDYYLDGSYKSQSLDDCVKLCADLYTKYKTAGIDVARIGLQSSDNISDGGEIAGGPYHPAFGQLVKTELLYRKIKSEIESTGDTTVGKQLNITVPNGRYSDCAGQKRANVSRLQAEYGFKSIKIIEKAINPDSINIEITD